MKKTSKYVVIKKKKENAGRAFDAYKNIVFQDGNIPQLTGEGSVGDAGKESKRATNGSHLPQAKYPDYHKPSTGVGIVDIYQSESSVEDEGVNTLRVELTDGTFREFKVRNGSKGDEGCTGLGGIRGPRGAVGAQGPKGDPGVATMEEIHEAINADTADIRSVVENRNFGLNTIAGSKAFTILSAEGTHDGIGSYTLDSTVGLTVGDVYTAHVCYEADNVSGSSQGENYGAITAINGNTVTVDRFFLCEDAQNAENPVFVVKSSYLDSEGYETEQNTFRIAAKPLIGTRSVGQYALAEGRDTRALSKGAHAEGYATVANGSWSHAEGKGTEAQYAAHAEGGNTKAIGHYAHAEGYYSKAQGFGAHAESHSVAYGMYAHAEGETTKASGSYAHSEGYKTAASGQAAHAEGESTVASHANSHAEGKGSTASGAHSHAEGVNSKAVGYASHAENQETVAEGAQSHAEGYLSRAIGLHSHAEGYDTEASGEQSHASGGSTVASGNRSHSEGNKTSATGSNSHAQGNASTASGENAHAEGRQTTAQAQDSHAEGFKTQSTGHAGHAEGNTTIASGDQSHAQGWKTEASGARAHAGGESSIASGLRSFAHGNNVKATGENQAVFGQFNENRGDTLFEVGNGSSNTARSNAFAVTKDGKLIVGGKTLTADNPDWDVSDKSSGGYIANRTHYGAKAAVVSGINEDNNYSGNSGNESQPYELRPIKGNTILVHRYSGTVDEWYQLVVQCDDYVTPDGTGTITEGAGYVEVDGLFTIRDAGTPSEVWKNFGYLWVYEHDGIVCSYDIFDDLTVQKVLDPRYIPTDFILREVNEDVEAIQGRLSEAEAMIANIYAKLGLG